MAKIYDIPPNTSEEEKAIGGVLTFVQFFWLLGGAVLAVVTYLVLYLIFNDNIIPIPFAGIVGLTGVPFAFYKKKEMTLFEYIQRKATFKKKSKQLINRRYF